MTWLLGLIGWGGAAVVAAVLILGVAIAKKWLYIAAAVGAVALALWGWNGYRMANANLAKLTAEQKAHRQTTAAFKLYQQQTEDNATAEKLARQQREDAHRDREDQITRDAAARVKSAQAGAVAVRADAQRMREQAVKLAASAAQDRRAVEGVAAASQRAAGEGRTALLADLLGSCAVEVAELAVVADRARNAGLECEARHDSAVVLTGVSK